MPKQRLHCFGLSTRIVNGSHSRFAKETEARTKGRVPVEKEMLVVVWHPGTICHTRPHLDSRGLSHARNLTEDMIGVSFNWARQSVHLYWRIGEPDGDQVERFFQFGVHTRPVGGDI